MKPQITLILFIMFLFSFSVRLMLTYQNYRLDGTANWSDGLAYLEYGSGISKGDWFPEHGIYSFMLSGPVIPVLVALAKLVTGDPIWPVLVLNCLFSSLLVFVLFELGYMLVNITAGYFMALWSIVNFSFIRLNHQILKEPLVILLIPLIVLCLVNIYQCRRSLKNVILSIFFFSILIHTDERFIVYTPIILIFLLSILPLRHKMLYSAIWIAVFILTMIPWLVRNYIEFNEIVILTPRTTVFTSKLWGSNLTSTLSMSDTNEDDKYLRFEKTAETAYKAYGVKPRRYGKRERYLKAFEHYWKPAYFNLNYIMYGNRPVKWSLSHNLSSIVLYGIFLPFYLIGTVYAIIRRNKIIVFIGMLPIIHSLLHTMMIWPLERYRLPMNCLVVVVALWIMDEAYKHRRKLFKASMCYAQK